MVRAGDADPFLDAMQCKRLHGVPSNVKRAAVDY